MLHDSEISIDSEIVLENKHDLIPGLKDFDLSFAENQPIHQTLAKLTEGDQVTFNLVNGKIVMQKDQISIAGLSKSAQQTR